MTLRRTKKDEVNGRPIIQLPEKIVEVVEKRMTADESVFYRQLESRSQNEFNRFVRDGWRQNYHHILVSPSQSSHACSMQTLKTGLPEILVGYGQGKYRW